MRQCYTVLRAILDTAMRDGLLARTPAAAVRRPRVTHREAEYVSPEQVRALIGASSGKTRYRLPVMISKGVPLRVVSEILGHASIAVTGDVYGHASPDVSREAVAALSEALRA